ncbi:protein mono-ADP-ribosyltransferase PARP4 isoform X2 [Arvicola amphibius]|uniref:protein mono-ADP-ribosyltransferase PARP4 isoform X2 n=1 Tax=Arvicola amphibius TaxID=1047088 RepID=UPI0018E3D8B0|nr:protein mono-ADP-ribosyltransferase PARP4 isoform X2 [Arvicola amphibius]
MALGIFANCTFCLKVKHLPRQEKKKLQADIKENGGNFSFLLNPQCTHVILDNADVLSRYQLNSIQKNDVQIASPDFIWDSVKQRRLLDVKNYDPKSLVVLSPPNDKSCVEVETEDVSLDNTPENENTEVTQVSAENVEIHHFLQDFEVVKYNVLEKVGTDGSQETVVVELQCSQDPGDCPFVISAHFLLADRVQTRRESTGKQTSEGASEYYDRYIEDLKTQGFLLQEHFTAEATQLASEKLQALLLEEVISSGALSQEVSALVEMTWAEALGHLEHTLLKPVNSISLNDVSKAEGVLLLVKTALKNGEPAEQLQKTMADFYRLIPHKHPASEEVNLRLLAQKEDLCQLVRDMVNVCETHLSKPNPPSLAKYRALRCKIEHVEQNTEEFSRVRREVLQSNHGQSPGDVLQIFRVGRVNEATEFLGKLGNVRSLFHGSPVRNILGILSRGLLLPKVAEDRGVQRTDPGNLGSGIYFSDSLSTSIKYSHAGEIDGSRLLVVCDVALGKCMDLFKKDFSLTEAPPGYDSVHGVSKTASVPTDFEDDEFVVYKTSQVKMKYIVKFRIPGDQIKDFHPDENTELEEHSAEPSNVSKVEDFQLPDVKPLTNVKAGLQDKSANSVPLDSVHIKGRIIDFVAQIIVFQTYTNQSHVPIEAKYIFPLDDKAAVCGFEAFINGKHIVGEIKEKEEAQQKYREAVNQGHGAYLMDQDTPDVFTVSVGNLPPRAKVLIKITYITELTFQSPVAVFFMPATVAPWQQDKALNENLQDTVEKVCIKEIGTKQSFSLAMSIEMPYKIEFLSSDTHELRQKSTDCKAVISTEEGSSLDSSGFSLHIGLCDAYLPRMWVEKHPEKESEACMLVFQPDLVATLPNLRAKNELIICLDCSNSMEGVTFMQAKQVALYALSLVGEEQKVNIMHFGTGYKELFSYPKYITNNKVATEFIMSAASAMGNTDFWKVLRYLSLLHPSEGLRNILLISDGHLQSESLTLQLVKRNIHHTRLFTCAVGSTANRHILRTLSQCGAGVFEYFNSKSKQSWKKQIEAQMTRMRSPSCHSVSVKWQQLSRDAPEPLQAPAQVPSLFHNDRLLVYGFIPHCTQATLCAFIQEKEFHTMVSTTELQKTTGTMIHKLAARALIRDYEDGILHDNETNHEMKKKTMKSLIIELSKENSLITQFTSFVAVEKRDANEIPFDNAPNILELVAKEDVDFLPYVSWQEKYPEAFITLAESDCLGLEQNDVTNGGRPLQEPEINFRYLAASAPLGSFDSPEPFSVSSEEKEKQRQLHLTKKLKKKLRISFEGVSEDFECVTPEPQSRAAAESPSVHSQLEGVGRPLGVNRVASMKREGGFKRSMSATKATYGAAPMGSSALADRVSVLSRCSSQSALFSPPSHIPSALPLAAPLPGGTHLPLSPSSPGAPCLPPAPPPSGVAGLPPPPPLLFGSHFPPPHREFIPFNSPVFGQSPKPAGGTSIFHDLGSPPRYPYLGFGSVTAFSGSFSSSDPVKVSQRPDIPDIPVFSSQVPKERYLKSKAVLGLPPLPKVVSSKHPRRASHRYKSASLPRGPDDRIAGTKMDLGEPTLSFESLFLNRSASAAPSEGLEGLGFQDMLLPASFETKMDEAEMEEAIGYDACKIEICATKEASAEEDEEWVTRESASTEEDEEWVTRESFPAPWISLFALQTEDGFWKLTPSLGFILKLNVNTLHNFLEEKGIRSLGTKGRDCLLDLIATLLVLQFLRTRLEQEGMVAKSLMKMDDTFISRNIPWALENIKKASEWARKTEGQYPSICQRLELGKDWESATKQLLGIQPHANSSLYRLLHCNQG